jgi:hypothetical protein
MQKAVYTTPTKLLRVFDISKWWEEDPVFTEPTKPNAQQNVGLTCWLNACVQLLHAWGYKCNLGSLDMWRMLKTARFRDPDPSARLRTLSRFRVGLSEDDANEAFGCFLQLPTFQRGPYGFDTRYGYITNEHNHRIYPNTDAPEFKAETIESTLQFRLVSQNVVKLGDALPTDEFNVSHMFPEMRTSNLDAHLKREDWLFADAMPELIRGNGEIQDRLQAGGGMQLHQNLDDNVLRIAKDEHGNARHAGGDVPELEGRAIGFSYMEYGAGGIKLTHTTSAQVYGFVRSFEIRRGTLPNAVDTGDPPDPHRRKPTDDDWEPNWEPNLGSNEQRYAQEQELCYITIESGYEDRFHERIDTRRVPLKDGKFEDNDPRVLEIDQHGRFTCSVPSRPTVPLQTRSRKGKSKGYASRGRQPLRGRGRLYKDPTRIHTFIVRPEAVNVLNAFDSTKVHFVNEQRFLVHADQDAFVITLENRFDERTIGQKWQIPAHPIDVPTYDGLRPDVNAAGIIETTTPIPTGQTRRFKLQAIMCSTGITSGHWKTYRTFTDTDGVERTYQCDDARVTPTDAPLHTVCDGNSFWPRKLLYTRHGVGAT